MGFFSMPVRRNPRRRKSRNPGGSDNMNADELVLFITNDHDLYRQNIIPVITNLAKKIKKGIYDPTKALKLWQYSAQWGAQKYTKENGIRGNNGSYGMFSPHDRREAAKQLAETYEDALREAAEKLGAKLTKSNPRRATMARRSKKSARRGKRVVFGRGRNRKVVVFKRKKSSSAVKAMRRRQGKRLAAMWTRAERMKNLRKAWAKNRRKGRRIYR